MTVPPDSLERLLKGLEGHVVESVEIEREDGFLHVKFTALELDPKYALHETLGTPKDLCFSVMWKRTFDRIIEAASTKIDEIDSIIEKISSELGGVVENLKKEDP